jgi:hypothetical protein
VSSAPDPVWFFFFVFFCFIFHSKVKKIIYESLIFEKEKKGELTYGFVGDNINMEE